MVAHEEQLGLRVVDNVVNLLGIELVEYGYGNGTIGQCGEEGHCPL